MGRWSLGDVYNKVKNLRRDVVADIRLVLPDLSDITDAITALLPSLSDITDWITTNVVGVLPTLSDITSWVESNLPTLSDITDWLDEWVVTPLEAITGSVTDWITANVVPVISAVTSDVTSWVNTNVVTPVTSIITNVVSVGETWGTALLTRMFNVLVDSWSVLVDIISAGWSDMHTYIKSQWKALWTINLQYPVEAIVEAYLELGLDGVTSPGGLKLGEGLLAAIVALDLPVITIYLPHWMDPLLFTDPDYSGNLLGNYYLSNLIADIVFTVVLVFFTVTIAKKAIKLTLKTFNIGRNYIAAMREKRWKREVVSNQRQLLTDTKAIKKAIGLKLYF